MSGKRAPDGYHAATDFTWDILVQCGAPSVAEVGATFSPETTPNGWFSMPDNCVIDAGSRLWISTDGNSAEDTGRADGLWGLTKKEGDGQVTSVHFFRYPVGGELCGPFFTPDSQSLFVAVQHRTGCCCDLKSLQGHVVSLMKPKGTGFLAMMRDTKPPGGRLSRRDGTCPRAPPTYPPNVTAPCLLDHPGHGRALPESR